MKEEVSSWIRRTKFSHTVCQRLDPARMTSIPLTVNHREPPVTTHDNPKQESIISKIQRNPTMNKQRAVSPLQETDLCDTFKEAKSTQKRFSTPNPRRKQPDDGSLSKLVVYQKDACEHKGHSSKSNSPSNTTPLRNLWSSKFPDKKCRKDSAAWSKYFDHAGGRVTCVEEAHDEHIVDLSKLFLGLRFAHGAHSQLYHGIYKDAAVAVKIIRSPDDDEKGDLAARLEKQFSREVNLLTCLHHSNIIKFVASCKKPPVFCIVTEYLSEGSLRSFLHKLEQQPIEHRYLPSPKLVAMALDIARGMEYIHVQGIIHRDLKPENILISESFQLKVADFGIACEEKYCDLLADDPGTYRWMAPEMIKRKSYGRKVDVYGFGLILWEMVAGTIPYEDMTPIQAAFAVVNKNLRPTIPLRCPSAMKALIEQCWSLQPEKRPEFWQIVKVLEQFENSLARDGTLNLGTHPICQDHKKGLLHWIQKLGATHSSSSTAPKPKFQ